MIYNVNQKAFLFLILIPSGLYWFFSFGAQSPASLYEFLKPLPKIVGFDLTLIWLFTKWWWKWKIWRGWLVPFPDLNGTWLGTIQSTWEKEPGVRLAPIPVMLTVKQTFGYMNCVMRTGEATSNSYIAGFRIVEEHQERELCYSYVGTPSAVARSRSAVHYGSIRLTITGDPATKLQGDYWTDRKTTGTVTLTFKQRELLDVLPPEFAPHPMAPAVPAKVETPPTPSASPAKVETPPTPANPA
jgi:hypothetical protein